MKQAQVPTPPLSLDEIKGSFVAMSVFKPDSMPPLSKAKGHRFYTYHARRDKGCLMRMAEDAKLMRPFAPLRLCARKRV